MAGIDVFISYARENRDHAKAIADVLTETGWSVWWDEDSIRAGDKFTKAIEDALNAAKCVLVLWSRHSVSSDWVEREAHMGSERHVLIPAAIEAGVEIPFQHKLLHTEDLSGWNGSAEHPAFEKLVTAIDEKIGPPLPVPDTILIHRLDSLKRDLQRVDQVRDYMQDIKDLLTEDSSSQLWGEILTTANKHIRKFDTRVVDVQSRLPRRGEAHVDYSSQEAWQQYSKILRDCENLFYETTEFLTGLVLRNALFQHEKEKASRTSQVYRIADEMVKRAAEITNKSFGTAVPAHPDSVTRTLLCLVRLRFPGWSIWQLPLLAFEYGRLLIEQDPELGNFIQRYREESSKTVSLDIKLRDLFSEVFATYYVGPAYAYVVTYLTLNPSGDFVADAERAEVVFSTLDHMGQRERHGHPYKSEIEGLRHDWNTSIGAANKSPDKLSEEKSRYLADFAHAALLELGGYYNPELGYPAEQPDQGWKEAKGWADLWQGQLERGQKLGIPQGLSALNTLRDVLNAGWICRLKFTEDPDLWAGVMEDTCRAIMETSPI